MYHFVALLWDSESPHARVAAMQMDQKLRLAALPWKSQVSVDGMRVFALLPADPSLRAYVLPNESGVVLGRLFTADLASSHCYSEVQLDEGVTREIVRTEGQHLVRSFWGGYVALLRDSESRSSYAIRDCSGKLPCYFARVREVTIVFADIADLAPLELPPFSIDWEYLAAFIYSSQSQIRTSAFKEVTEMLAGDLLEVRGSSVHQRPIWDPLAVYRRRRVDRYEEAVAELREVAQKCIDVWAQTYDPILHSLSGGFDSAVVLGCLSHSPAHPKVTCLTQFTSASYDDERRYARLAAARAGKTLHEVPMDSAAGFDSRLLAGPKTARPAVSGLSRLLEIEVINRIALETGAQVLWTGQGGDHIFLQTADSSSARDYLAINGPQRGFISAVHDAAHLSRQPYWFVLKSALSRNRTSGPPLDKPARTPYFVAPAALPTNPQGYVSHPWTIAPEDVPSGKLMQIRLLAEVINRHRPIPRLERAPQHHPLLSQPLMELCLQIPTYLLIRGGRERALARDAFADQLPTEIIRRRDKGSIVAHTTEMLRQDEKFVRELLLDGVLAGNGIIDPDALKPYILHGQPFREEHLLPLLACIAAEVWARTSATPLTAV
jgi:asparagine synthase (glutamine-hydrolysing)